MVGRPSKGRSPDRASRREDKARSAIALALAMVFSVGCSLGAPGPVRPLPPSNLERGITLFREGALEPAAAVLEQATKDFPDEPRAWLYLGLAQLDLGEHERAAEPFQKALELDDASAEAHYGLGVYHARSGHMSSAVEALSRAVALNPTHAYAHYYLALAYGELEETDETLLHLQRFADLRPDAPEAASVEWLLSRLR